MHIINDSSRDQEGYPERCAGSEPASRDVIRNEELSSCQAREELHRVTDQYAPLADYALALTVIGNRYPPTNLRHRLSHQRRQSDGGSGARTWPLNTPSLTNLEALGPSLSIIHAVKSQQSGSFSFRDPTILTKAWAAGVSTPWRPLTPLATCTPRRLEPSNPRASARISRVSYTLYGFGAHQ